VGVELATIFRQHSAAYCQQFGSRLPQNHWQAMRAIEQCRTEALGGHIYLCQACNEVLYSYHSCRNRHCPKCQNEKAQQWLEKQQDFLLPVPYFLLTFTVPAAINSTALNNQALIYDLIFRASAAATQHLARDPRFVGGQIGMIGILHTWGRNLSYHPHVHYLVPAGGIDKDGNWLTSRKSFLLPVKALSKIFRAKFRAALQRTAHYQKIPTEVWHQDWVVHCQPVGSGQHALKYLAPYIFRVAISNNRILKMQDGKVTFYYKASDTGKARICTLSAIEFIRRFLQHVLPKGFVKIRYYGFFSPGCRAKLAALRQQLEASEAETLFAHIAAENISTSNHHTSKTSDTIPCHRCGLSMQRHQRILPKEREPP
jgi:hypothetical protein